MRGDRRRKNFFGATTQPHTNRTTAQVPHLWRHLGRRGARRCAQQDIRRPTIAPTASTFARFGGFWPSSDRQATDRTDGQASEIEDARRATSRRNHYRNGRQVERQARTTTTIVDTFRDSGRHRRARKSIFGYRYFFIYLRQKVSVLIFGT